MVLTNIMYENTSLVRGIILTRIQFGITALDQ
jgi:hypothetical protein